MHFNPVGMSEWVTQRKEKQVSDNKEISITSLALQLQNLRMRVQSNERFLPNYKPIFKSRWHQSL